MRHTFKVSNIQQLADLFAVSSSGLCALHCLATPILLILLPVLSASMLADEAFHMAILWFILPTSIIALGLGCSRHKDLRVALLCTCGLATILLAAWFGHKLVGEVGEKALTAGGSLLLIAGHVRNFTLCRGAACDH
jgi:hypothetical protein